MGSWIYGEMRTWSLPKFLTSSDGRILMEGGRRHYIYGKKLTNHIWLEWFEADYDWEDIDDSWLWDELNAIDGRDLQELFQIRLHQFAPDALEVAETGYLIDDLDLLNHLDFVVHKSYYGTHLLYLQTYF